MLTGFQISKCAILADPRDPEKTELIRKTFKQLQRELEREGIETESFINVPVAEIQPHADTQLFLVLGGDGTMIHFAARLNQCHLPFYGLNYGNVGFMMNNPREGLASHARRIKRGEFAMWEFPVLRVRAVDHKGYVHEGVGLNDIYLQRMTPQSCKVNIILGGSPLDINPLLCDGVIVATPLGSTAYNYNVNGSLVAINTAVLTLTPVASHRSCPVNCMMLPLHTTIRFDLLEPLKRRVQVVSDGQSHGDLTSAEISVSPFKVRLCFDPESCQNLPMRFINKACR